MVYEWSPYLLLQDFDALFNFPQGFVRLSRLRPFEHSRTTQNTNEMDQCPASFDRKFPQRKTLGATKNVIDILY